MIVQPLQRRYVIIYLSFYTCRPLFGRPLLDRLLAKLGTKYLTRNKEMTNFKKLYYNIL